MPVVDKLAVHRNERRLQTCKGVILRILEHTIHAPQEKEERSNKILYPSLSHCRAGRAGVRCGCLCQCGEVL